MKEKKSTKCIGATSGGFNFQLSHFLFRVRNISSLSYAFNSDMLSATHWPDVQEALGGAGKESAR